MATSTLVPIAEYLETTYHTDHEYIDGELRERNVGKWEHSRLQYLISAWFARHENEWQVMGATEQRLQVASNRIRIPDIVILTPGEEPPMLVDPPLLIIEVLSPDDTYSDTQERATDYLRMGVQTIWIIDPKTRTARACVGTSWHETSHLEVPGTSIYLDLPELFPFLTKPGE